MGRIIGAAAAKNLKPVTLELVPPACLPMLSPQRQITVAPANVPGCCPKRQADVLGLHGRDLAICLGRPLHLTSYLQIAPAAVPVPVKASVVREVATHAIAVQGGKSPAIVWKDVDIKEVGFLSASLPSMHGAGNAAAPVRLRAQCI